MPTITVIGQEIKPASDEHASLQEHFDLTVVTRTAVQLGTTRGVQTPLQLAAADDDVVELEYSNGLREWLTAGDLHARYAGQADRGITDGVTITTVPLESTTRGPAAYVLTGLKLLGIDPAGAVAHLGVKAIIAVFEGQLSPGPGLYHLTPQGTLGDVVTGELAAHDEPYLLLLHGTFLTTDASFHHLFTSPDWAGLWRRYKGRIYGFNHRTLSQSPAENALELIGHLPPGARLHLVSHSRGGLVGELLCLDAVTARDLAYFKKAGRSQEMETLAALSEQLQARRPEVQRFVRVACPARGTLLASQRLDRYLSVILNLMGLVPPLAGSLVYDFAKASILTLIKTKADVGILPGLEAMIPESPLIGMLNRAGRRSSADLAVIAGDIEAGGVWDTLQAWTTDIFYREDHDLVVNTRAMYGGLQRPPAAVYYFRRAPDMTHFNYFSSDESRRQIYGWLTHEAGATPDGFHSLAEMRAQAGPRTRAVLPVDAPRVILIPGMFASHLKAGDQRIWIDLEKLAAGRLERLALDRAGRMAEAAVTPDGIVEEGFADLIADLSARFQVLPFAYDWRLSLRGAAECLATAVEQALPGERSVYLLAHGSGGLVARALMAYQRATWDRLCRGGGRLVMLGTPHHGTYAALELLSGRAELARMLDLLDSKHGLDTICRQFRRYPGLVELLPHDQDTWKSPFLATLTPQARREFGSLLADAAQVWRQLEAAVDPAHMCCVAVSASSTLSGVQTGGTPLRRLDAGAGDGFVSAELSQLAGVPTWYIDAAHGGLVDRPTSFRALAGLLLDGATAALTQAPPPAVKATGSAERPLRLVLYPTKQEFIDAAMGCASRCVFVRYGT